MNNTQNQKLDAALKSDNFSLLVRLCKQALRKSANHHQAHRLLGYALHRLHEDEQALKAYAAALVYWPNDAELLLNYGQTLIENGMEYQAIAPLEKATRLRPTKYLPWLKLSESYYRCQMSAQGFECGKELTKLAQNDGERVNALLNLAIHGRELGDIKGAVRYCEEAMKICPTEPAAHTNRLLFMLADSEATALDIRNAATDYASIFEAPLKPHWPVHEASARQPWERLRIGFLSPDFRNHSVMYFVEGLLSQLDRRQFTVIAFHLHPGEDGITDRVKKHADIFIKLANRSLNEQVDLVQREKPDILIDLAGHTGNNGLFLMLRKLAPIQISWLGFPATTGLTAMDYKFTDEVTDPVGADAEYSENLFRMSTLFCCYRPHIRNPLWRYQPLYLVQPTPAIANGYVTFGSCNNLGKLTDAVLQLWGKLLQDLPTAHLLIEGKNLDEPEFSKNYQLRCEKLGIPLDRLTLIPLNSNNQYLTYHQIDIALDPFPLTGGTTTFDLLWMGVPLVSLVGDSFKSRLSTGILSYLGKPEWLASSTDEYLSIAKNLAANIEELNATRQQLRQQVESSPLMNEREFNSHFASGLRVIWLSWLAQHRIPNDPAQQELLMQNWLEDMPEAWKSPAPLAVGTATGERLTQDQAYQRLELLLNKAKQSKKTTEDNPGQIFNKDWRTVTEFAETVLTAIPHDPVALTYLAEIEHAHQHTDFAVTYLQYATQSMGAQ